MCASVGIRQRGRPRQAIEERFSNNMQHHKDQAIRIASGERIIADVSQLPPDENTDATLGIGRIGDREMRLAQFDCCFTGDQWIEYAVTECLIAWAEKHYSSEVTIVGLFWDEDDKCWTADVLYDGPDDKDGVGGVTFTLDDENIHIQHQFPHSIVVHF